MTERLKAWLSSSVGQWAQVYADYGFSVFPCHGISNGKCTCGKSPCGDNNKQAGKHPFTRHGVSDASKDLDKIATLFNYRTDLNIAIATGAVSGVFVLDIDNRDGISGEDTLRDLQDAQGAIPETLTSITGNGRQMFFKMPSFDVRNATGVAPKLDIRGTGGYVVTAPSTHYSGKQYTFDESTFDAGIAEAPAWLLDMLRPKIKPMPKPKARPVFQADNPKGEAAEALSYVPNDDYWLWVEMAMALSDEFGSEGFEIWDSWSSGSPKYNGKEMWRKWQSFRNEGITIATLFDQARLNGWRPEPIIRPEADTSLADAFAEKFTDKSRVIHAEEKAEPKPAPARKAKDKEFDPLKLEGLIGDTVRWICSDAMFPMPTLALLHVLAWAGAVFGRRYASPVNTRTNLYLVGVANTATGKNHSRVKIPILAREAGLAEFGGAHGVISDTGIARSLYDRPSQVLMLDEWGLVLQSISDKKAPSHNKKIKTLLMALYSQSGSSYSHGDYANKKLNESISIENPNLCVYGTTTEREYVKALSKDAVESGELNRVMAIKADPVPRRRVHEFASPPQDLIDGWARFSQGEYSLSTATNGSIPVTPKIVGWGECDDLQWNLALEQDAVMQSGAASSALWGRRHENIIKIAMIFAIARNMEVPEMRKSDFEVAVHLVDKSIYYMTSLIDDRLPETDYESAIIEVQDFIRKEGKAGVARTTLSRRFRKYKSREMDDIITSLLNQEVVLAIRTEGKTRGAVIYKHASA